MRGWRAGLLAVGLGSLGAIATFAGCSAEGASDPVGDPEQEAGTSSLPPLGDASTTDAPKPPVKKDGGEAGVDSGPPPPVPGTACTKADEKRSKKCGKCGDQTTLCLFADPDAGAGTWTEYGPCENETGVCVAGESVTEDCGNCGKITRTCTSYCVWTATTCTGQPVGGCTPGNYEFTTAGCTDANTFRYRTCQSTCQYDSFSVACGAPPTTLEVPPTIGSTSSTIAILAADNLQPRLTGTCPTATISTTYTSVPTLYLQVHNPLTKTATVSIYNTQATGGAVVKTTLAAYAGASPPGDDTARKACLKGTNAYGTAALTGNTSFASLDGTRAVTLAPGDTVTVYMAAQTNYDGANPATTTGKVNLVVKTEQLN